MILGGGTLCCLLPAADGATPEEMLARYEKQAHADVAGFKGFSAEEGRAFYFGKYPVAVVGEVSCFSCHLRDPRRSAMRHRSKVLCRACHVINDAEHVDPANAKKRELEAFAPVANPRRFADPEVVEKWFKINCHYILQRPCTTLEKGNLITWLLSLERTAQDNKPELGKEYDFLLTK
jgi:hypothetical protein